MIKQEPAKSLLFKVLKSILFIASIILFIIAFRFLLLLFGVIEEPLKIGTVYNTPTETKSTSGINGSEEKNKKLT